MFVVEKKKKTKKSNSWIETANDQNSSSSIYSTMEILLKSNGYGRS
jgi:hypothetical protein